MFPLLIVLALLAVAYAALSLFYWAFQERFIFIRFRLGQRYRFRFKEPFEEHTIEGTDGAALHALWFKAEAARGLILYFHGNSGSLRRWGKRAARFLRSDYDVLMPDYRGYGKSRGPLSEAALHDDARRWYEYAKKQWPESDIILYGRSLGSAFAVPIAADGRPRMLILESPFANLVQVARNYLPLLPYKWLLRYRFENDKAVGRVRCPVYVLHGARDGTVPYTSALRLYAAIDPDTPRAMITFPDGYHNDLANFPLYRRTLRELLGGGDEMDHALAR